ncbi:hypothetical protein [Magnetospirillum sulfuroxidans]|uniref:hypothetical protein n=1 Tax=Magnetospirillum sulfuroxidans TaxID=611300 RepID=UPI0031FF09FE
MRARSPHLWLALSPHGFGHAAMTASVITEVQRRRPDLRLTIQTGVDARFLHSRYRDFKHIDHIADFGFRMVSATGIDLEASARDYAALMTRYADAVADNALMMAAERPDLVVSNVAFVPLAAAARLGIASLALSSLNWADMYRHYLGDRPEAAEVLDRLYAAYHSAEMFLHCTPGQAMSLKNLRSIGPIANVGHRQAQKLRENLGQGMDVRIGLVAFGGIDHDMHMGRWPELPGWLWLSSQDGLERPDIVPWQRGGLSFTDLIASVEVVVTKPGYGTFTEAGMVGAPVLYTARPDWPESPHLDHWLAAHTQCLMTEANSLVDGALPSLLHTLFSLPRQQVATPDGVTQAAEIILSRLPARIETT